MDLPAFCEGSYEDALAYIQKRAEEVQAGEKRADIGSTLSGWGNQIGEFASNQMNALQGSGAGRWMTDQSNALRNTDAGRWWNSPEMEPARTGLLGAGIGAGAGLAGTAALGTPGRRRYLSNAALGAGIGGFGGAMYGATRGWEPPGSGQSPTELAAESQAAAEQARLQTERLKTLRSGGGSAGARSRSLRDFVATDPAAGFDLMSPVGLDLPVGIAQGFGSDALGTSSDHGLSARVLGATAGVDLAGNQMRRWMPTGRDIRTGLQADPKHTIPSNTGSHLAKLKDNELRSAAGYGLRRPLPGIQAGSDTILPHQLRELGTIGQSADVMAKRPWIQRPRFAGTAMPRTIGYGAPMIANWLGDRIPRAHQEADSRALDARLKYLQDSRAAGIAVGPPGQ